METLTIDLVDFRDALNQAKKSGGERHVLLGNGFSIGAHEEFRYGSLFERAKTSLPRRIQALFHRYGTTNFEVILRQLDEGAWLAEHYGLSPRTRHQDMRRDYETLKEVFVDAIGKIHPDTRTAVADDMLFRAASFLKNFDSVFTTCYDLLLYWAILHSSENGPIPFQDGFAWDSGNGGESLVFLGQVVPSKRFVHFLHGALHLTAWHGEVHKLTREESDFEYSLVEQIRDALEERRYPLVVLEGDYVNKLVRIESSNYLSWVFRRFQGIRGHLFTYGTSFSDEDRHLQDAIAYNPRLKSLFVGVYGDVNSHDNQRLISSVSDLIAKRGTFNEQISRRQRANLDVSFYDSSTAPVWDI